MQCRPVCKRGRTTTSVAVSPARRRIGEGGGVEVVWPAFWASTESRDTARITLVTMRSTARQVGEVDLSRRMVLAGEQVEQ